MKPLENCLGNTQLYIYGMNANGAMVPGIHARLDDIEPQDLGGVHIQALSHQVDQSRLGRGMAKISDANFHGGLLPAFWAGKARDVSGPGGVRLIRA